MEAFSDCVFAVAATLLVVDIAIHPPGTALEQVLHAWPAYFAYVISFLTIGARWLAHTELTNRLARTNPLLLRINLLLLLAVAFLPFPTQLVADALHHEGSERVFVTVYGLTLLAIRILGSALDAYARHEHLDSPPKGGEEQTNEPRQLLPVLGGYVIAILIGLAVPGVAVGIYFALAVYMILFPELKRHPMPRVGGLLGTGRMEAFSDNVFSFAATLLVVDIAIHPPGTALEQVLHAWPAYFAYVISFLTIGAAWLAHTELTNRLARTDPLLLRINLLVLLVVVFLPFPTKLVADALHHEGSERVFVTVYGLTLLAIRILGSALDAYARHEHLDSPPKGGEEQTNEPRQLLPVLGGYVIAILIGLAVPGVAVGIYFALAVYMILFPELKRHPSRAHRSR